MKAYINWVVGLITAILATTIGGLILNHLSNVENQKADSIIAQIDEFEKNYNALTMDAQKQNLVSMSQAILLTAKQYFPGEPMINNFPEIPDRFDHHSMIERLRALRIEVVKKKK